RHVCAVEEHLAGVGRLLARERAEEGRLARARRAEHTDDLTGVRGDVDTAEDRASGAARASNDVERAGFEQRRHGVSAAAPRGRTRPPPARPRRASWTHAPA